MNEKQVKDLANSLKLPKFRYYPEIGSTNDIALDWAKRGAPEFSLVVADSQSSGRGRLNRIWETKQGEGLAFSLVLRPKTGEHIPLFSALGGISVCEALIQTFHLHAMIKWPNDVLIKGKKICGILAETHWEGTPSLVLGIGINVGKGSVPSVEKLNFPATSLEKETQKKVDRILVLTEILKRLIRWRLNLGSPEFFAYWRENLAFLEKAVQIILPGRKIEGILQGISKEGNLQIQMENGTTSDVEMGDVKLRPIP
jgi:BirA family biotin operon repressor/biotin-[acetyl-CoA-carboxylase] ligase